MKQIQKIITSLRSINLISEKTNKIIETENYLSERRQQYVASTPVGFKARTNSDYFLQRVN